MSTDTAIRKSITVAVPQDKAFSTFTAGINRWWPREHHIGQAELDEAIIEAREGGRWYERDVDGSECDWGRSWCGIRRPLCSAGSSPASGRTTPTCGPRSRSRSPPRARTERGSSSSIAGSTPTATRARCANGSTRPGRGTILEL